MPRSSPSKAHVVQAANALGLSCTVHPTTGDAIIDGLRWDLWWKYKDTETTRFCGRKLIKEL